MAGLLTNQPAVGSRDGGSAAARAARGSPRGRARRVGPPQAAGGARDARPGAGEDGVGRPPRRGAVGRRRRRRARRRWSSSTSRVCVGCSTATGFESSRAGAAMSCSSRDEESVDARPLRAAARATRAAGRPRAVARRGARRPRRRAVRGGGDPTARGASAASDRARHRRRSRGRPPWRGDRRARRARHRRAVTRAPACPAHARAVPLGSAGRRRWRPTATRAPRSWSRSVWSPAPSCGACRRRSSRRIRRSTCPRRPNPEPRDRAAARRGGARTRCSSSLRGSLLAGVLAFGVIRVLEPDGLPGIDEDARRADRPRQRPDHRSVPSRAQPGGGGRRRRLAVVRQPTGRHRHAHRSRPCKSRRSTSAANRAASRTARGHSGWRTARVASCKQIDAADQQGRTGVSRSAMRRTPSRSATARSGWRPRSTPRSCGSTRRAAGLGRRSRPRPGRPRWRRERARSGSRATATGRVIKLDPRSGTALADIRGRERSQRHRRGRGRGVGGQPQRRDPVARSTRTAR